MACQAPGPGHVFCGTRPCGCPHFLRCEHTDPVAEQQRIASRTRQESSATEPFLSSSEEEGEWDSPDPIVIPESTVPDRSPEEAALACLAWVARRNQEKP